MTITLGGLAISDNMYLGGINNARLVSTQQERTIDGLSVVAIKATPGGRSLSLGSVVDSSTMGIWCQSVVDELKVLEENAQTILLDYHGESYRVVITGCEFTQLFKFEPVTPTKKYTGQINLLEV